MIAGGRGRKMPCEGCAVQFSVFKRKRVCCECERYYCSGCLRRGGGAMCVPCRVLSTRPLYRNTIAHLKVRDLQCFLQRQNVSTRGCVEKDELVNLCVLHVNGASYRRSGARSSGAFSSLKGLTTNINDFLNSAFDIRTATPAPQSQPTRRVPNGRGSNCGNCFNATHGHRPAPADGSAPVPPPQPHLERFTTTPGGERDIEVPVPADGAAPRAPSEASEARVESADCFEIEDLDDSVWEFVARAPAAPLPDDSDVLLTATDTTALRDLSYPERPAVERPAAAGERSERAGERPERAGERPERAGERPERAAEARLSSGSRHSAWSDFERIPDTVPRDIRSSISRDYLTPGLSSSPRSPGLRERASSSLELRSQASTPSDTASLKDELGEDQDSLPVTPQRVTLEQMKHPAELDALNVKQLKELLTRNRVEYRGCIERHELLQRAKLLWRDHAQYKDEIDNLPIEECCKICMAAPLECVLLECGHIAACTACSKQLAECPICRQYVVRAVRFFRS